MSEIHRPQWNGIIDVFPTVIQCGSQNPHDEVQMVCQNEWLRVVPFEHVQQSLYLWLAVTLKSLCMCPSPRKCFHSITFLKLIILFHKKNLACALIAIHFIQCALLHQIDCIILHSCLALHDNVNLSQLGIIYKYKWSLLTTVQSIYKHIMPNSWSG